MDEYTILKKKRKKNGFASTALLISIAIALIAMVGTVLILSKVDNKKVVTTNENAKVADLKNVEEEEDSTSNKDATCEGLSKEIVFNDNLKTIKEAAISYFTNERLPQTVGDSITITLKEMKKAKLVRNVYDAYGKSCSGEDSYVEVTKNDNEYIMKVFLSCSNMEDYIIVHLGCYDYCDSDVCEKKTQKEYEYEYKKTNSCEVGDWSSWGEWQTKREKTSNLKKEDIKVETISKDVSDTKDATKVPGTYSCSKYSGYKLVGTKCVKETTTKDVKDATPSKYSYSCDKYPGYSVYGSKCIKETKKTETIDASKSATTYTCSSGYTLSGTTCTKTSTSTDTMSGSYSCPSGYSLSGTTCSKTTTWTDTVGATASYSTRTVQKSYPCKKQQCTTKTVFSCSGGKCGNKPQTSCTYVDSTCYESASESYVDGYDCPSGYSLSGTTCSKSCSSTDTKSATFSCPSGYTASGTTCSKTNTSTDTKNATANEGSYYCKSGYTLNGTKCERTVIVSDTKEATKVPGGYTCPEGYKLSNKTCTKETKTTDTKTADSTKTTYTCPSGYTLSGTKCYKSGTQTVKKTYYRYATRECVGGSTSYEWSTSKNDKTLISEGYKLTGKKRELTSVDK